ncbi:MAG TPA: LytTR family transcriptional regulator DNA-binding domain-containing protein [Acidobacteriaceae bacterium]|nr:LytTR family transcriptional regulator DNA-binding domain-containing protein [Acidobacteriaceae bacterium]
MLRITVEENGLVEKWILQGHLTENSITELVLNWQASRTDRMAQHCIVDLNEITSIDKTGEEALLMMIRDGAEFIASGLYTKHLLEALKAREAHRAQQG